MMLKFGAMSKSYYLTLVDVFFFFNDPPTPEISPLPLHDALPILTSIAFSFGAGTARRWRRSRRPPIPARSSGGRGRPLGGRSEEHTSELQSRQYLVCRLLLEKKHTSKIKLRTSTVSRRIIHTPRQ